jgi:hypothetical protein
MTVSGLASKRGVSPESGHEPIFVLSYKREDGYGCSYPHRGDRLLVEHGCSYWWEGQSRDVRER